MAGTTGARRPRSWSMNESASHHSFGSLQFDPIELLTSQIPFVDPFDCDLEDMTVIKTEIERQPTTAIELSDSSGYADEKSSMPVFPPSRAPAQAFKELWDEESDEQDTSLQHTAHDKVVVNVGFKPARSPATSTRRASLSQGSGSKFRRTGRTSSDSSLDTGSSSPGNMFEVAELSEGFSRTMSLPTPGPSTFHDALPEVAGSSAKKRFKLTSEQAIHIFTQRTTKTARTALLLSEKYGISPKAIRDIWTLKSWAQETRPFWTRLDEQQSTARHTNR